MSKYMTQKYVRCKHAINGNKDGMRENALTSDDQREVNAGFIIDGSIYNETNNYH